MLLDTARGQRPRPGAGTNRQALETIVGSLVHTVFWALLLQVIVEAMMPGVSAKRIIGYTLQANLPLFLLGAFVIWVVLLLVLAITGRLWLSSGLVLAFVLLLGAVNRIKIGIRQEPLYPSDVTFLGQPAFLVSMVPMWQLVMGILGLMLVVVAVVLLGRSPTRTFMPIRRRHLPRWWVSLLMARIIVASGCLAFLGYATSFNEEGNRLRLAYDNAGATWAWWYQVVNYRRNTVIGGFLYNQLAEPMVPPESYNEQTMGTITDRWVARAAELNGVLPHGAPILEGVNIVVILSEAFSDPLVVQPAKVEGDPLPYTRSVMDRSTSGNMLAQMLGGGTANMEFEVLSGQSLSQFKPQVNTPYQQFVHEQRNYPTVVGYLKDRAYRAIAIHPYFTKMYQRERVYQAFGIDEFVHDTTMRSTRKIDKGAFISDAATFDEVLGQIESSEKPLFANVVTMQNHYPMDHIYDDPWPVSGVTGKVKVALAGYARGLNHSDQALQAFLGELERSGEKTAIVFYGDHLPGFWSDEIYQRNGEEIMRATPWFVWTNFETTKLSTAPMTSPIYFMPLLFEQIGAQLPPYYALLHDLYQELPAFEAGISFDREGRRLKDDEALSPRARDLLEDFRLVQYDLSVGERYAQDQLFYPQD